MQNKNILSIDYDSHTVTAMRDLVKKVLSQVSENGLPDKHHFYITFITHFRGVTISDIIKNKYPDEMTIVIENSFWDLRIDKEYFSIKLSFDGIKNELIVPFNSLTAFSDPYANFHLKFPKLHNNEEKIKENETIKKKNIINIKDFKKDK